MVESPLFVFTGRDLDLDLARIPAGPRGVREEGGPGPEPEP